MAKSQEKELIARSEELKKSTNIFRRSKDVLKIDKLLRDIVELAQNQGVGLNVTLCYYFWLGHLREASYSVDRFPDMFFKKRRLFCKGFSG